MKKCLLLLFGAILNINIYAQSSVEMDTLQSENKVEVSIIIGSEFNNTTQLEIQYFNIIDLDTISVFEGNYDFLIQDPSGFSQFELNTETNQVILNLGWFDPYNSFAVVRILNEGQTTEEFTLN